MRKLPPGPSGRSREEVEQDQRARLHAATVELVTERGYADTRVADLIAFAGVSRRKFYECFGSKQACMLASFERIAGEACERIGKTYGGEGDGLARIARAALRACKKQPKKSGQSATQKLAADMAPTDALA